SGLTHNLLNMNSGSGNFHALIAGERSSRAAAMAAALKGRRQFVYYAACLCLVVFFAALILQHGHWTRSEEIHGPFEADPAGISQYRVAIGTDIPFLSIPSLLPNGEQGRGKTPPIELWINGKAWNPKTSEPWIEQGKLLGIRGLYRTLHFKLPSGIASASSTILRGTYPIRVHTKLYSLIAFVTGLFILLAIKLALRSGEGAWLHGLALRSVALGIAMHLASWALIIACAGYAATIAYGLAIGDALPTA